MDRSIEDQAAHFMVALCDHLNNRLPIIGAWRLRKAVFSPVISCHRYGQKLADFRIWPSYMTMQSIKLEVGLQPDEWPSSVLGCLEDRLFSNVPDQNGLWDFDRLFSPRQYIAQLTAKWPSFVRGWSDAIQRMAGV